MPNQILLNDFRAEPEELIQQEMLAVERVIRSGWYILGQELKSFEHVWREKCGIAYAVGMGNGMDALEVGLRAVGIGAGDEVITTPMTAFATVLAILRAGATPVLADVDPITALLDIQSVKRSISTRTKALLLVHLYGQVRAMEAWQTFCQEQGILLLEDCAQSHLARWNGQCTGSFGAWGAYSFYPTKNLGALGDGGALVTNSRTFAEKAASLRNYGQSQRYHHPEIGLNSRLDEIQAALLSVRLTWLENFTKRRQKIATNYYAQIDNPHIQLLAKPLSIENHVYHLFVLLCSRREHLIQWLHQHGITSLIHYPIPVHHQPPCKQISCDPHGLGNAECHAQQCLTIPCHPQMSDEDVTRVIDVINRFDPTL